MNELPLFGGLGEDVCAGVGAAEAEGGDPGVARVVPEVGELLHLSLSLSLSIYIYIYTHIY